MTFSWHFTPKHEKITATQAKKELKGEFGKLKKQLAEDGLHIKQQERYMAIARNKNIQLNNLNNIVK